MYPEIGIKWYLKGHFSNFLIFRDSTNCQRSLKIIAKVNTSNLLVTKTCRDSKISKNYQNFVHLAVDK